MKFITYRQKHKMNLYNPIVLDVNRRLKKLSRSHKEISERAYYFDHLKDYPCWTINYIFEKYFKITQKFSERWVYNWYCNRTACGVAARAVMQLNVFHQAYYVPIQIHNLYNALSDSEPGCFMFEVDFGTYFTSKNVEYTGHGFVIIKYVITPTKIHYQLVQSYIHHYTLKQNLIHHTQYFTDFNQLKQQVLDPLLHFYSNKYIESYWEDFTKFWHRLTKIKLQFSKKVILINSDEPYVLEIIRTTNIPHHTISKNTILSIFLTLMVLCILLSSIIYYFTNC